MEFFNINADQKLERYKEALVSNESLINADSIDQLVYTPVSGNKRTIENTQYKPYDFERLGDYNPDPVETAPSTTPLVEDKKDEEDTLSNYFKRVKDDYLAVTEKYKQLTPITELTDTNVKNNIESINVPNSVNNLSGDALFENTRRLISANESSHNYGVVNPDADSGAWGRYQFIWGLRKGRGQRDAIKKVTGHTTPEGFLRDPEAQEKYFRYYYNNTLMPELKRFRKEFPNINWNDSQTMEMLHFRGYAGLTGMINRGELNVRTKHNPSVMDRLNKKISAKLLNGAPSLKINYKNLNEMNVRLGYK